MVIKKNKIKQRLTADERREAILATAIPLFAEIGFRATTTKMLAKHVGVSEALLYQHFPSKEALYAEVQNHLCKRYPALEHVLGARSATTESLVFFIFLLCQLLIDPPVKSDLSQVMPRAMLQSILDDGVFARMHIERNMQPVVEVAARAIAAARKAGDIVDGDGIPDELKFLFAHHVIVMVNMGRLPTPAVFNYPKNDDKLIDYVMRFILRGMGMTDQAVAKYYDQARLRAAVAKLMSDAGQGSKG